MIEVHVVYAGGLRSECRHGPSGAAFTTDAPVDNQGRGESFSPTDLVATGLGSCMLTVMGIVAERNGWPLDGATARVEKHMSSAPLRRVGRLVVELRFPQDIPDEARRVLEHTALTCPVKQSIHPDIEVDVSFAWGGI